MVSLRIHRIATVRTTLSRLSLPHFTLQPTRLISESREAAKPLNCPTLTPTRLGLRPSSCPRYSRRGIRTLSVAAGEVFCLFEFTFIICNVGTYTLPPRGSADDVLLREGPVPFGYQNASHHHIFSLATTQNLRA